MGWIRKDKPVEEIKPPIIKPIQQSEVETTSLEAKKREIEQKIRQLDELQAQKKAIQNEQKEQTEEVPDFVIVKELPVQQYDKVIIKGKEVQLITIEDAIREILAKVRSD